MADPSIYGFSTNVNIPGPIPLTLALLAELLTEFLTENTYSSLSL